MFDIIRKIMRKIKINNKKYSQGPFTFSYVTGKINYKPFSKLPDLKGRDDYFNRSDLNILMYRCQYKVSLWEWFLCKKGTVWNSWKAWKIGPVVFVYKDFPIKEKGRVVNYRREWRICRYRVDNSLRYSFGLCDKWGMPNRL